MGMIDQSELNSQRSQLHVLSLGEGPDMNNSSSSSSRSRSISASPLPKFHRIQTPKKSRPRTSIGNSTSAVLDLVKTNSQSRDKQVQDLLKELPDKVLKIASQPIPQLKKLALGPGKQSGDEVPPPLHSPALPSHQSKNSHNPMGAHSAGFYSKMRQSKLNHEHLGAATVAELIHEHKKGQQQRILETQSPEPELQTTLRAITPVKKETPKEQIPEIPSEADAKNIRWLESFIVRLTDADASLEASISTLRAIVSISKTNEPQCAKVLYEKGATMLLISLLKSFPEELEVQLYGITLLTLIYEHIDAAKGFLFKPDNMSLLFKVANFSARVIIEEDPIKDENVAVVGSARRRSSVSGLSRRFSISQGKGGRRNSYASNAAAENRRRSSSMSRKESLANKRPSLINEENENDTNGLLKTIPVDGESIIDGLLSEYYQPDFISRFEEMGKRNRVESLRHLLSQFEKIDKLLNVTNCTSFNVDLEKALHKILMDTEEMMQAEMILFYEIDPDTSEIIPKTFENIEMLEDFNAFSNRKKFPPGSGIAGYAAATGDMINIADPVNFPRFHPAVDLGGADILPKNILSTPLALQDGPIIAVIQLVNRFAEDGSYQAFTENDEYLLKLLARTLAIVLTNARSIQRMTETKKKVEVLLETTRSLSSTLDFDMLIKMIMEAAKELLSADRCTLFLKDEPRKQLVAKIVVKDSIQEIRIKMDAGIAGSVLMSGKSINIRDAYKDSRFNPEVDRQTGYNTRTILCMPIKNMTGECIGVTQMINKKDGVFTLDDEHLLSSFSAQAAVAIEKTQLFKKTEDMRIYQQSILASITSCVITLNESMRMVSMNRPWFMNAIGSTTEVMMEQPVNKWISPQNESFLHDILQVYKSGKPIFASEYELKGHKSSTFINYQVMPLIVGTLGSGGVVMVLDDISSEKKAVMTLGRYMSPELAKQVLKEDGGQLGGTRKKVSILFSDIRSFTKISEAMEPHNVVELLNQHFTGAVNAIIEEHGILDKFIGDAVMAVFGVPYAAPEDPVNSCNAALRMRDAVKLLNQTREAAGQKGIQIGIGINTGLVLSGNIGSPKRMEYSCIGDAVNLASRVEGLTKGYGVTILVTEFTLAETADLFFVREVDSVIVTGKTKPVKMYELIGKRSDPVSDSTLKAIHLYSEGMSLYKKRKFEEAGEKFQKGVSLYQDGPSRTMLERCQKYMENPPDKNWNGVYVAEGK